MVDDRTTPGGIYLSVLEGNSEKICYSVFKDLGFENGEDKRHYIVAWNGRIPPEHEVDYDDPDDGGAVLLPLTPGEVDQLIVLAACATTTMTWTACAGKWLLGRWATRAEVADTTMSGDPTESVAA